ncbi:transcription factor jun-D [Trichogramma pretiosum]|uniref:transcription factor jun-D n=1 Tax=Trichogramma pretiosum TaxID=7493 RepID=UPI0006C9D61D|nr:transcription factor jun-D [Trichogramma pretiosum]
MVRNLTPMEPTFYEEQPQIYGGRMSNGGNLVGAAMKRSNLTLDLNRHQQHQLHQSGGKRQKIVPLTPNLLSNITLNSPDMFKIASPEFEKLLLSQGITADNLNALNAGGININTPTSQMYSFENKSLVTEEQEHYARGFVDALEALHHSDSSQETGAMHGATYTNLEPPGSVQSTESSSLLGGGSSGNSGCGNNGLAVSIKDEPQTVPSVNSSPPVSPIDMENQERIKLERKRQRNRVAASKCRKRKLERISKLEERVKVLKGENTELSAALLKLRETVSKLKEQVISHLHSGCHLPTHNGGIGGIGQLGQLGTVV